MAASMLDTDDGKALLQEAENTELSDEETSSIAPDPEPALTATASSTICAPGDDVHRADFQTPEPSPRQGDRSVVVPKTPPGDKNRPSSPPTPREVWDLVIALLLVLGLMAFASIVTYGMTADMYIQRHPITPFGRDDSATSRCLAFGYQYPADEVTGGAARPPLRCTFYCTGTREAVPAACLVERFGLVLDMHLLRLAPTEPDLACEPARERWTWAAQPGEHLACRWPAVRLEPYGLVVADDPALALALQLAKDEAEASLGMCVGVRRGLAKAQEVPATRTHT